MAEERHHADRTTSRRSVDQTIPPLKNLDDESNAAVVAFAAAAAAAAAASAAAAAAPAACRRCVCLLLQAGAVRYWDLSAGEGKLLAVRA